MGDMQVAYLIYHICDAWPVGVNLLRSVIFIPLNAWRLLMCELCFVSHLETLDTKISVLVFDIVLCSYIVCSFCICILAFVCRLEWKSVIDIENLFIKLNIY
jgi:hypothetical protein